LLSGVGEGAVGAGERTGPLVEVHRSHAGSAVGVVFAGGAVTGTDTADGSNGERPAGASGVANGVV
jgi:hypothetical protein